MIGDYWGKVILCLHFSDQILDQDFFSRLILKDPYLGSMGTNYKKAFKVGSTIGKIFCDLLFAVIKYFWVKNGARSICSKLV